METKQEPVRVALMLNGPIVMNGTFEITHSDGTVTTKEGKAAFCRCGQSANKPFCDGTHKRCGWSESE